MATPETRFRVTVYLKCEPGSRATVVTGSPPKIGNVEWEESTPDLARWRAYCAYTLQELGVATLGSLVVLRENVALVQIEEEAPPLNPVRDPFRSDRR